MNKYKTINGKIRHAHGPVGMVQTQTDADGCCECGYLVCSQTGPCVPKPKGDWVYNREMDMLVYETTTAEYQEHVKHLAAHMSLFAKMSVAAELHSLGFVSPAEALDFLREDDSE
jgi:hypothetical protein